GAATLRPFADQRTRPSRRSPRTPVTNHSSASPRRSPRCRSWRWSTAQRAPARGPSGLKTVSAIDAFGRSLARFMVGAVRGKLQFGEADGGTELEARVVRWSWVGRKLISFHRRLGRYERMTGNLTLDDGTVVPVKVKGPFLRVIETPQGT